MQADDWGDYDTRPLRHGVWLGCGFLALAFIMGAFFGILAIWTYQELGFRS